MNERIEDLFPLYALGALTDEERMQVDAYVASAPDAEARLAELIRAASALPYAAEPVDPSPEVKQAVMERVNADARARSAAARRNPLPRLWDAVRLRLRARWVMPVAAGLSVLAAGAAFAWAVSLNGEVARLRAQLAALQRDLAQQRQTLAQIAAPNVRTMAIAGTEHQPAARGQLVADPRSTSAVLVVSGLLPLNPGQVYQFWLIRGESPVSAGVFSVDEEGRAVLSVTSTDTLGSFDAMGVSIEPEGGSPQPTGDIVMLGRLS